MKSICVYCGSSPGARPEYAAAAVALFRSKAGVLPLLAGSALAGLAVTRLR